MGITVILVPPLPHSRPQVSGPSSWASAAEPEGPRPGVLLELLRDSQPGRGGSQDCSRPRSPATPPHQNPLIPVLLPCPPAWVSNLATPSAAWPEERGGGRACVSGGLALLKQGLWLGSPVPLSPPSPSLCWGSRGSCGSGSPGLARPRLSLPPPAIPWAGATAELSSCQGRAAAPPAAREAEAQPSQLSAVGALGRSRAVGALDARSLLSQPVVCPLTAAGLPH